MGHPHIRRKGLQSTRKKPPDNDHEQNFKTNVFSEIPCTQVQLMRG